MTEKLPPLEIGQTFGDWTVIAQPGNAEPRVGYTRVQCACGTEKIVINNRLRKGRSRGCGCRRGRQLAMRGITHGKSYTPNYRLWSSIKHRLKSDTNYINLGTKMYEPWRHDFTAFDVFIMSLGPKPTAQHTLDRIEPTGDYAPGNLRWADKTTQSSNRRNAMVTNLLANSIVKVGQKYDLLTVLSVTVVRKHKRNWYGAKVQCDCGTIKTVYQKQLLSPKTKSCGCFKNKNLLLGHKALEKPITAEGETLSLRAWARRKGISPQVIWTRIHKLGWDPADAVTRPLREAALVEVKGEKLTAAQWSQRSGVPALVIMKRLEKFGWDPERAVTQPVRGWHRKSTQNSADLG